MRAKKRAGRRLWSCSTKTFVARHPNFDPMDEDLSVFLFLGNICLTAGVPQLVARSRRSTRRRKSDRPMVRPR